MTTTFRTFPSNWNDTTSYPSNLFHSCTFPQVGHRFSGLYLAMWKPITTAGLHEVEVGTHGIFRNKRWWNSRGFLWGGRNKLWLGGMMFFLSSWGGRLLSHFEVMKFLSLAKNQMLRRNMFEFFSKDPYLNIFSVARSIGIGILVFVCCFMAVCIVR